MPRLFYTGNRDNVGLERWANDMDTSVQSIQRQLAQSREQAAKALTQAATTNAALGLPSQPTNFSINATEYYQDGSTYEQITATYTAPTPLGTFAGVFIVVSGYNGSTTPVKVAEDSYTGAAGGSQSVVFKLYRTGENVTFYAVPRNHNNAAPTPWTNSPYATHILGDVTAPAAPTGLAATNQPGGVALTWNANTEKNLGAYKIYRNISNSFSGASLIDVIGVPRSGTPSDFDPTAVPNTQYYYFVTAVNTADMEGSNSASAGILATVAATLGSVTGTQRNLVPDSDLKFGTTYAVPSGTSWPIVNGGGLNGGNAFSITGTGAQIAAHRNVWTLPFVIGQTYTLSGNCRNSGALSGTGTPRFLIYRNNVEVAAISAPLTGGSGRYSTSYTVPSGTTSLQLMAFSDSPTVPNGVIVSLDSPQWEVGNVMTKYVPNALDDATGGLASGIPVQSLGGSLGLQIGDVHDRANNAIDTGGNGYLIKNGLVRWRALGGDTSGDTTADLVDAANKRFLHGAMSGATQATIANTGLTGMDNLIVGNVFGPALNQPPAGLNFVENGDFESSSSLFNGYPPGWTAPGRYTQVFVPSSVDYTGTPYSGLRCCHIHATGQYQGITGVKQWVAQPGESFYLKAALAVGASTQTVGIFLVALDKNGAQISAPIALTSSATSFQVVSGTGVMPANTVACAISVNNRLNSPADLYVDAIVCIRQAGYGSEVWDDGANGFYRLAGVASDNTGLTLGYSGYPQMVIGQGTITLPTGGAAGYQVKKTLYTAPTGTEANGTVISFSSLTDQSGNALPTFDTPPLVALQPYDMSTPPVLLYASGTTTTGFTLNSYSAATSKSGPGGTLVNGTDLTLTADAGTTFTGVSVTCSMTTKNITPYHPNVVQTFAISINDVSVGTISVSGAATGAEYQKSQNFSISGNPTSVKVSATWTLNGDASSASATVTSTEISNPTAVSANIVCAISELWN